MAHVTSDDALSLGLERNSDLSKVIEEEDPVYANTRPVANKQPSPRPGTDHLKAVSSSQNPRNPSPGRKYDEGKRRYK